MFDPEYDLMRQSEDTHWWYRTLHDLVDREATAVAKAFDRPRVLDAGCGTGGLLDRLRRAHPGWHLQGLDVSPLAVRHCHARGLDNVMQGDVADLPLADASVDLLISCDVLYHAQVREAEAVMEFRRVLAPGGKLLLNLPAYECLRGRHDEAVAGVRRYTPAAVRSVLAGGGFQVDRLYAWNVACFLPILIWRQASRHRAPQGSDLRALPSSLNTIMACLVGGESRLARRCRWPIGTSIFSVASRPVSF